MTAPVRPFCGASWDRGAWYWVEWERGRWKPMMWTGEGFQVESQNSITIFKSWVSVGKQIPGPPVQSEGDTE